jgi:hypothetical protein
MFFRTYRKHRDSPGCTTTTERIGRMHHKSFAAAQLTALARLLWKSPYGAAQNTNPPPQKPSQPASILATTI